MTVRHIKIFCAVCENDYNTTKAAAQLNMTQPAVSLAIKELEGYYGINLFDRIGRRLMITPAGEMFLSYASHISSLFDDMEKGMKDWDYFGKLRVGASITIGSQFLPKYIQVFSELYPGTDISVLVAPDNMLVEKLLANELDFALVEGMVCDPVIISEPYMADHLTVVCPSSGPYRHGQSITLEEFKKNKLLLRNKGSGTREVFDNACSAKGFIPVPQWESTSTAALINAAINGLGIAVLPYRMVAKPIMDKRVVTVNVEELDLSRQFYIVRHKDKYLTSSAKAFIDLCKNYEANYPAPNYNSIY